ncbi:MAG: LacI family DNA-binding transcriptional regulator [Clostridiales bacterium]|nr:LacI family DNA-binding transcriptional regulator [Clostridiales bacterium]
MKVTLKDIAHEVGLSPTTVSLVLNNRPSRISEETKEKILSVAQQMGYRPNPSAVSLKTNRSYTIGLIVPDIRNDYYATYAKGLEDTCQQKGWSTILCSTNYSSDRERQYIETLYAKSIDGISLIPTPPNEVENNFMANRNLILSMKIPLVQTDLTNYTQNVNAVVCDHEKGGYMATRHLISLGHRKIAFITGSHYLEGSESRLKGCKKAFLDNGLDWNDQLVYEGNYSYESGLDGIDYLSDKDFTAVFAFNDLMACGAYNGLNKYNLSVPEDISVIGYDDHFVSGILSVPLTTVRQPIYEMGKEAARILIHATEHPETEPVISQFDLKLIVRNSTRKI